MEGQGYGGQGRHLQRPAHSRLPPPAPVRPDSCHRRYTHWREGRCVPSANYTVQLSRNRREKMPPALPFLQWKYCCCKNCGVNTLQSLANCQVCVCSLETTEWFVETIAESITKGRNTASLAFISRLAFSTGIHVTFLARVSPAKRDFSSEKCQWKKWEAIWTRVMLCFYQGTVGLFPN